MKETNFNNLQIIPLSWTSSFNPLYTESHFLEVFLKLCGYFVYLYFHFCCELALDTWAMGFSINALGVHELDCISDLTLVSSLTSKRFSRSTGNCLQYQKCSPYTKAEKWFLRPFVLEKREMVQLVRPKPFYSQSRQAPSAPHVINMPTHVPHCAYFASAKLIFKTDCAKWPTLHDKYTHHQLLNG